MIDIPTVHQLALALPGVEDNSDAGRLAFSVCGKSLAWSFMKQPEPLLPERARLDILAVRCRVEKKELLIDVAPDRFFDDEHYHDYPAILVRLDAIEADELSNLLEEGWRIQAANRLKATRPTL